MRADNVGAPVTPQQWNYIHAMGGALRESLENVTAVFAPSCIGHSVLTKRDWQNIKIDDVSFTDSLRCWENSLVKDRKKNSSRLADNTKSNKHNKNHHKKNHHQSDQPQLTVEEREQRRKEKRKEQRKQKLTPEEREQQRERREQQREMREQKREQRKLERRERRRQERLLQKMEAKNQTPRALRSPQEIEMNSKTSLPKIIENEPVAKQQQKKRRQQANQQRRRMEQMERRNSTRIPKHRRRNQQQNIKNPNKRRHDGHNRKLLKTQNQLIEIKEPKKCSSRLLERCSWPQCNHSCPSLTNPLTGEEMKFLELLSSFGLDMDAVAQALGVDMQTLSNMDHKEFIKLFTESTS